MIDAIFKLQLGLPALETAVYEPLIRQKLNVEYDDDPETWRYMRTRIAMGRYCREASELGLHHIRSMGMTDVRKEIHSMDIGEHHFLSIPDISGQLSRDDLVVDPTYLQFAKSSNPEELMESRQNIFIGTRMVIASLMRDPSFSDDPDLSNVYGLDTLISTE